MVSEQILFNAVNEYIDTNLSALCLNMNSFDQFLFNIKLGIIKNKLPIIGHQFLTKTNLITDDQVDVDTLYNIAKDALNKQQSVEISGFKFTVNDLEVLYEVIKKHV